MIRNVLLVTIDSLRYDSLPPDGPPGPAGAPVAGLDPSTVAFERAFATGPGTTPSFPALLTGTLPLSYGGLGALSPDRPRVSGFLRDAGLATGGFQCNPFLSTHFAYDVGFDEFRDYQNPLMGIATKLFPRGIELNNPKLRRIDDALHLTDAIKTTYRLVRGKPRPYVSADVVTDDALEWLAATDGPFFCWAHYMDVHHPCFPPARYREARGVGEVTQADVSGWYADLLTDPETLSAGDLDALERLYRAAIDFTLDQVERLIDHLRTAGVYEETLVVLTSDHGELFGEHGLYGKPERMIDELLHVPLLVANGPDHLADAAGDLVSLLDVPPLVHDALGLDVPDAYEGRVPGRDDPRDLVVAEHEVEGQVIVGARSADWLYEGDEIRGEHRLFDLRDGGLARVDADHADPGAAPVREAVRSRLTALDVDANYLQDDVGGDVEDRLEDLGYL